MRILVVSIRDLKAECFMQPWYVPTPGVAERMFSDQINSNDSNSLLAKHPQDFDLCSLGFFDDSVGLFETGAPVILVTGMQVARREDPKLRSVQ